MMHPLAGVIEKLRNADVHLQRLYTESLLYLNGPPGATIFPQVDPSNPGQGRLIFKVTREPPLKLGVIAGDVVHNLRSALGYMIEALVRGEGLTPTVQHQFPISSNSDRFAEEVKKGRIAGISGQARRFIEGIQPYNVKPKSRPDHPLRHLKMLSNRDKHHMLVISGLNAKVRWQFIADGDRVVRSGQTTESVEDGGVLATIPTQFVIGGEQVKLQQELAIQIGFTDPSIPGFDPPACLQNIREFIGLHVVPAMETFLGQLPDDLRLKHHGIIRKA